MSFVAAAVLIAASGVRAQESPRSPGQPRPAAAAQASAAAPDEPAAPRPSTQRIYHIRQLENMLTNAVKAGAASMASRLQVSEPNSLFVTGTARTRGFELAGYGVFFDVDVPTMMQSVLWSSQQLQQQQYVDSLRRRLTDPGLDPAVRGIAQLELGRMERAMARGLVVPMPPVSSPQPAAQGIAVAQTTESAAAVPVRGDVAPVPVAAPADPRSADELYTDTIKAALIDAMLSYGNALQLEDHEWLTIAARATSQGTPGQLDDSSSVVIRIQGSDLSAFLKGRMSREEVLKKIEIKEG